MEIINTLNGHQYIISAMGNTLSIFVEGQHLVAIDFSKIHAPGADDVLVQPINKK